MNMHAKFVTNWHSGFREEYKNVPDYGRRTASDDNTSYDTLGQVR